jgi:hypothetical protein
MNTVPTTDPSSWVPPLKAGARYFIMLIDNSASMRDTALDNGDSLFDLQVREMNAMLSALKRATNLRSLWVLRADFSGALGPWTTIDRTPYFERAPQHFVSATPLLDILAGCLDALEFMAQAAQGARIQCGITLATDGLDGVTSSRGVSFPCSRTEEYEVKERLALFTKSGFIANALAIGPDNGDRVFDYLSKLGFPTYGIRKSGLDPQALRRAFHEISDSSFRGLE